ncbi:glutamyl-tRNA synthetase [Azorhizobium caulinodans ORS 571]|uniref:Glutamyl-tRNA synthetase n=1 Tax=Azorhizobium caulinodans (strain ATCC 43989 / DSM 5975 / JCM 20966 / LMG 6465 / NBRC 14845 / NCIMB 13405 / ORS 571) TaxID=438753 RepID=A8I4W1_AZOC5|nr:glutamyl-tRNA synthetase [Azorhizobium caulinodans ORS 571]
MRRARRVSGGAPAQPALDAGPAHQRQQGRQLRPRLAPRQRQPQRMEQRPAAAPAGCLGRRDPALVGRSVPWLRRQHVCGHGEEGPVVVGDGRRHVGPADVPPAPRVGEAFKIAAHRQPEGFVGGKAQFRQTRLDRRERQEMERARGEARQIGRIEPRRCAGDAGEVHLGGERIKAFHRRDRFGRAHEHRQRRHRERLLARLAQRLQGQMPEALGQALAIRQRQEIVVGKARGRAAQRLEQLDLDGGVGDMILAANHVGDAHVEIVHHGGERVEEAAVGTHKNRIGEARRVHLLRAAHAIDPAHQPLVQPEAPVGTASFRLQPRPVGRAECQRRPVIDRRQATGPLQAALEVELFLCLVRGIKPPHALQPLDRRLVEPQAVGLPDRVVRRNAQPHEILSDSLREFGAGADRIGIVEAQHESAASPPGQQRVQQGGARIAHMDEAGGRGSETEYGGRRVGHGPTL